MAMTERQIKLAEVLDGAKLDEMKGLYDVLRENWDRLVRLEAMRFRPGQQVQFLHAGQLQRGVVTHSNVTTVGVDVGGRGWRVGPNALTLVKS